MNNDITMYSLAEALRKVESAYTDGYTSVILHGITKNCAIRVKELFTKVYGVIVFKDKANLPCATFIFSK